GKFIDFVVTNPQNEIIQQPIYDDHEWRHGGILWISDQFLIKFVVCGLPGCWYYAAYDFTDNMKRKQYLSPVASDSVLNVICYQPDSVSTGTLRIENIKTGKYSQFKIGDYDIWDEWKRPVPITWKLDSTAI